MNERDREPLPDTDIQADIIPLQIVMDVANNPALFGEQLQWMRENDRARYRQVIAIANRRAGGDMTRKEAMLEGAATMSLLDQAGTSYGSLDKEYVELLEREAPLADDLPERKFRFFRRRRAGAAAGVAAVSTVTTVLLGGLKRRGRFNDDDVA